MSYCRFGPGSNAYVIGTSDSLQCLSCRLMPVLEWYDIFVTNSRQAMIDHLQEHRQNKSKVPFSATRRLKREIKQFGDRY